MLRKIVQGPFSPRRLDVRRLPTAAAITAVVALMFGVIGFVVSATTSPVSAETSTTIINEGGPDGFVAVVKVSGLLDPVMVDFIRTSIDEAIDEGAVALILQADSNGVVVEDSVFASLLNAMLASSSANIGHSFPSAGGGNGRLSPESVLSRAS